ncbi:hypothetical protein KEJ49_02595 [Candidatus Bathyarchaeota archaeon]|nr:hypothetical protein [Candidatus Bathyarchaeota archaeon]
MLKGIKAEGSVNKKVRTTILGCVFAFFLALAYLENISFLRYVNYVLSIPPFAVTMFFIHNIIAVSLIIIGMSFYVDFVPAFLPKRDIDYVVLNHPRIFALAFTIIILTVSVLRVYRFHYGFLLMNLTQILMLLSLPHGILEAFGIYRAIYKTLKGELTNRVLAEIYMIFLLAAILEVGFLQVLKIRY